MKGCIPASTRRVLGRHRHGRHTRQDVQKELLISVAEYKDLAVSNQCERRVAVRAYSTVGQHT